MFKSNSEFVKSKLQLWMH